MTAKRNGRRTATRCARATAIRRGTQRSRSRTSSRPTTAASCQRSASGSARTSCGCAEYRSSATLRMWRRSSRATSSTRPPSRSATRPMGAWQVKHTSSLPPWRRQKERWTRGTGRRSRAATLRCSGPPCRRRKTPVSYTSEAPAWPPRATQRRRPLCSRSRRSSAAVPRGAESGRSSAMQCVSGTATRPGIQRRTCASSWTRTRLARSPRRSRRASAEAASCACAACPSRLR
mmetsp:Transcript_66982/g.172482  ORF Transcript_66982/g.172482 Transcript_66982/m.172482 type:complete len:233 (-) Transcript_66982:239-937(-)